MGRPNRSMVALVCITLLSSVLLFGCSRDGKAPAASPETPGNDATLNPAIKLSEREPESPSVTDCGASQTLCHDVLDCSDDSKKCLARRITFDIERCAATTEKAICHNFQNRLATVSLIADLDNFVSAPMTQQSLSVETIIDGMTRPWDLEFLPDGSMLITLQLGSVVHLDKSGELSKVLQIDVLFKGESGLMGMAVDPEFTENNFVYIAYSYKIDDSDSAFLKRMGTTTERIANRISRFTFRNDVLADELYLLDNVPGSVLHTGLRLEFGPDGKLYASTGDAHKAFESQDPASLVGKILRMNKDGSIPDDNPFPESYVYSRGHRNPQGMAWHPETGDLYVSEHGPQRYDEINRVFPGGNHGWGSYKCDEKTSSKDRGEKIVFPVVCFKHWNIAPSGMEYVADRESPWFGSLFVASLRGKHLHRFIFDGNNVVLDEIFYVHDLPAPGRKGNISRRIRDVEYRGGSLYIIGDFQSSLLKLTPVID